MEIDSIQALTAKLDDYHTSFTYEEEGDEDDAEVQYVTIIPSTSTYSSLLTLVTGHNDRKRCASRFF